MGRFGRTSLRSLGLALGLTMAWNAAVAPLAWAACAHHFGIWVQTPAAAHGDYYETLANLPQCSEARLDASTHSDAPHDEHESHACHCGDQNCLTAKAGAAPDVAIDAGVVWDDASPASSTALAFWPAQPDGFLPPASGPPA